MAGVFDFGLANRTFAVHDLATALERATVFLADLIDLGRAEADLDASTRCWTATSRFARSPRPEAAALPEVFPVVHVEYALSEVEYFADRWSARLANADLAYDGYLLGHAAWFGTSDGATASTTSAAARYR